MEKNTQKDGEYYTTKLIRMIDKIENLYEEIKTLFIGYHQKDPFLYQETIKLNKDIQHLLRNNPGDTVSLELFNFCCQKNLVSLNK